MLLTLWAIAARQRLPMRSRRLEPQLVQRNRRRRNRQLNRSRKRRLNRRRRNLFLRGRTSASFRHWAGFSDRVASHPSLATMSLVLNVFCAGEAQVRQQMSQGTWIIGSEEAPERWAARRRAPASSRGQDQLLSGSAGPSPGDRELASFFSCRWTMFRVTVSSTRFRERKQKGFRCHGWQQRPGRQFGFSSFQCPCW
jgi:hypothetical protein